MTRKSVDKSTNLRPFKPGPDPKRGRGPKKGAPNAGRPRKEAIAWCMAAVSDPKGDKAVKDILHNPKHPQFVAIWSKLMDRAYGPAAVVDEDGTVRPNYVLLMPPVEPV